MAQVLELRRPRSCLGCEHFDLGIGEVSTHCVEWDEPIDDESVAATCPDYQPPTERQDP